MEKNKQQLQSTIKTLRQFEAPDIWMAIQEELDSDEQNKQYLQGAIKELKVHKAPDIPVEALSPKKGPSYRRYMAIAASIAAVVMIGWRLWPTAAISESNPMEIGHTSTTIEASYEWPLNTDYDDVILGYVKNNCIRLAATCEDPEFKALLETYIELNARKQQLNRTLENDGDQPEVVKHLIKVEKEQTQLGMDIIKKLRTI